MIKALALLGAVTAAATSAVGSPMEITFQQVTNNSGVNLSGQLKCILSEVTSGAGDVSFLFTNNVGINSSITEIYYDDGTLLGIATLLQSSGVNFSGGGANPPNLPGGETLSPPFVATQNFSADAIGATANGINASAEWLDMRFDLISGQSFADTVAALQSGALRIGLHIRAIGPTEDSDSYVNVAVVPLPPGAWLGAAGLAGLGLVRAARRRR